MRKDIKSIVRNIGQAVSSANWWKQRAVSFDSYIQRNVFEIIHSPVFVADKDWDNLIILDACRADAFYKTNTEIDFDRTEEKISPGSATPEWTRTNFAGRRLGDTVYVTSNPYTSVTVSDVFHKVIEVWRTDYDEDEQTVRGSAVVEAAIEAHRRYPNKRLIIHFMQPHAPFIGSEQLSYGGFYPGTDPEKTGEVEPHIYSALAQGLVSSETVRKGYMENVEYVMEFVREVLEQINGKSIVTSDHGDLFNERLWPIPVRFAGHRNGLRQKNLVRIPWAVHDSENRRVTTDEGTTYIDTTENDKEARERLKDLGYL